jgi:hypothetical protein
MADNRSPNEARAAWPHLLWVAALIVGFWANSWQAGLGTSDFPGHVGLLSTLRDQLFREPGLPLWTSDWYLGASLLLNYLHPLFSLAALAPFAAVFGPVEGLRIGATFYLVLSAVSMYAFSRAFGGSNRGAAIGALIYALHPSVFVFVGVSGHLHQPVTMAIVPLVFLSWLRLAEQLTVRRVVAAAVASALLFYDMQRFWLIFPFALALYAATVLSAPSDWRSIRRSVFAIAAVGTVMAGLLCFPAVPGLLERELLQWHHPASLDLYRERNSLPGLASLLDRDGVMARGLEVLGPTHFASFPGQWYQGIVALFLVGMGAVLATRVSAARLARSRLALALALWTGALWLAMGVHAIGQQQIGALREVARVEAQGPGLAALFGNAALGCVMVAWIGLVFFVIRAAAMDRWSRARATAAVAVAVLAVLALAPFEYLARWVFVYGHIRAPGHFGFPLLGFWLGAAASVATPLWDRLFATRPRQLSFTVLLVALLLADVLPYRDRLDSSFPAETLAGQREAFGTLSGQPPGRLLDTRQYNPLANMLGVVETDRRLAWGWLGWSSTRFTSELIADGFYAAMRQAVIDPSTAERSLETAAGLAGLANVRFVSAIGSISPPLPESTAFVSRWKSDAAAIHENLRTLSYAHFYPELALLSGSPREVLPVMARLSQRGVASVTMTEPSAPQPAVEWARYWFGNRARTVAPRSAQPAARAMSRDPNPSIADSSSAEPCTVTERQSRRVELSCEFERPGFLSIAESWAPSWQARVDGTPRDVIRMNHAFQGVRVQAGEKRIEFRHHASSWVRVSLWVSAASWLAVALFAVSQLLVRSDRGT